MRKFANVTAFAVLVTASASISAAQVNPTSYDMHNGDGQAHSGSFNYWDLNYTGSGATSTDGAPLTGGLGDLTDGFLSTSPWYSVENSAGNGPYVGWVTTNTPNPTVTFHFAGSPTINSMILGIDNTGVGGVSAPSAILVDGSTVSWLAPAPGTSGAVTISGLNLSGSSHSVQFLNGNSWVFVSEVDFFGSGVPEASTWASMVAGFALTGGAIRTARRRRMTVSA